VEETGQPEAPVVRPDRHASWDDFSEFYRAELPGLVALARGLCGTAAADDVAQEAMLVALRRWEELRRYDQPQQWVRRTCANLAVSSFRRRVAEVRALVRFSSRPPSPAVEAATEEFWDAVRRLPRRQAQCAALRYLYAMRGDEIAATLGISEGAVKVHLARARDRLASHLESEQEES
jgi:RNA polymerase sigma-70 factor (ECF subfamily)